MYELTSHAGAFVVETLSRPDAVQRVVVVTYRLANLAVPCRQPRQVQVDLAVFRSRRPKT